MGVSRVSVLAQYESIQEMTQQVFKSQYPILEACMNKGSTLPLALAVHRAGGYPSLCSWTYNRHFSAMQADLDQFVAETGSNCIHLSFELDELSELSVCYNIVKSHGVPTIEIIYGQTNAPGVDNSTFIDMDRAVAELLKPLHDMGTKIFRRIYEPVDQETMKQHYLDGFCIKGLEAAGFSGFEPVHDLFLKQKELTPDAMLIPYGGIGTAAQVREYLDLGAEMVGIGTVLALSEESTIKHETKLAVIAARKDDLKQVRHVYPDGKERKQNMLQFEPYQGRDDANGTAGLVQGIWKKNSKVGHIYVGHSVDHIDSILPCNQIIKNLVADL